MLSLCWEMNWNAANIIVKEMHGVSIESWTWVHAIYAIAGVFILETPGFPKFPINSTSMHNLYVNKRITPPAMAEASIWGRSQACSSLLRYFWRFVRCPRM